MSDMQELIVQTTSRILKENCTKELLDQVEEGLWPKDLWNTLAETGLLTIGIPEEKGGVGGDCSDAFQLFKLIGKYAVPLPIFETVMVNWLMTDAGSFALEGPVTFALDEEVSVQDNGEDYQISGKLENVPWANDVKEILVHTTINHKKVILFVEKERCKTERKTNLAGEPIDTVFTGNVCASKRRILPIGDKAIENVMELGALARSAMMCGALDKTLELTVEYVRKREQFGRPLYKLQAIQQHLAVLSGEIIASNTITDHAIDSINKGEASQDIAYAKIVVNRSASIAADLAHQIHGAIGATYEHALHHFTRRLWTWRAQYGNEAFWSNRLAEKMIRGTESLWGSITK